MLPVSLNRTALVLGLLITATQSTAATFTVTNYNDAGAGSLRQAIADANSAGGADTITFQAGMTGTILLTTGQLTLTDVSGATTITGPGANLLTVSGNHASRVFQIGTGATAAISGLPISNGTTNAGGAGVFNQGSLTLTACTVRNNTDTSGDGGGGVWSDFSATAVTISDCLFSANQAVFGSAIEHYSFTQALITNVTVSGNASTGGGAGIVEMFNGSSRIESCTITGNVSGVGAAGAVVSYAGAVQYRNTIVSGNTPNQFASDVGGTLTSLGHNLSSDGTGNLTAAGDLPNTNPMLGPLANNGGPTMTHALLAGSPAIDAGDPVTFPATDQRGIARPQIGASCTSAPDIGAFELQPAFDCNNNDLPDECEIADGTSEVCNGNNIPDECDISLPHNCCEIGLGAGCSDPTISACVCASDPFCCNNDWDDICVGEVESPGCGSCSPVISDCDSNGTPDECDPDADNDGLPDACDPCPNRKSGDVNGDNVTDSGDVSSFVAVLLDPGSASADELCAADTNGDTMVDGRDTASFIGLILAP